MERRTAVSNSKEYNAKYYKEHREEIVNRKKAFYKKNKQEIIDRNKRWFKENNEKWNEYMREYRKRKKNVQRDTHKEAKGGEE